MTLAEARGFLKWNQSELARAVGTSPSVINDLETGDIKSPGYSLVMRIVKALQRGGLVGVTAEDIFPVNEPKRKSA